MNRRLEHQALRRWAERDANEESQARLPEGESVQVPAVWVAELYTPSTVPGLFRGISELGWDYDEARNHSLAKWMSEVRLGQRAGWTSLGLVTRPGNRNYMRERTADLPNGAELALPVLMSVTPSLTALVIAFLMTDETAAALNRPLRAPYSTRTKRLYRTRDVLPYVLWNRQTRFGRTIRSPDLVRNDEVRSRLREIETRCTAWVAEKMPGVFASGLRNGRFPTGVLVVTDVATPLTGETANSAFRGLSLDRGYDAWQSKEWPDARLVLPRSWRDEVLRLVIACRRPDVKKGASSDSRSNWTIAQEADEHVRGILSRWALTCLLDGYHHSLSALRDRAAARRSYRPVRDLKDLRVLVQTQLYDIVNSAREIEDFVDSARRYRYEVTEMQYGRLVRDRRPELLEDLKSSQRERARQLQRESTLLQSTLSIGTEVTQTISNIRVQRLVVLLTIVTAGIALAALLVTIAS